MSDEKNTFADRFHETQQNNHCLNTFLSKTIPNSLFKEFNKEKVTSTGSLINQCDYNLYESNIRMNSSLNKGIKVNFNLEDSLNFYFGEIKDSLYKNSSKKEYCIKWSKKETIKNKTNKKFEFNPRIAQDLNTNNFYLKNFVNNYNDVSFNNIKDRHILSLFKFSDFNNLKLNHYSTRAHNKDLGYKNKFSKVNM